MVDTDDNRESIVRRLCGSQRTLMVVGLILLIAISGVAVAVVHSDDFEDQSLQSWNELDGDDDLTIEQESYNESYSAAMTGGYAVFDGAETVSSHGQSSVTAIFRHNDDESVGSGGGEVRVGLMDTENTSKWVGLATKIGGANERAIRESTSSTSYESTESIAGDGGTDWYIMKLQFDTGDVRAKVWQAGTAQPNDWQINYTIQGGEFSGTPYFYASSETNAKLWVDRFGYDTAGAGYAISGTVTGQNNDPVGNVSVETNAIGPVETNEFGEYTLVVGNGTYNVTASKDGYFPQTETVSVDGEDITQDFSLTERGEAITIDTRPLLEHGESAPYEVTFENTTETGAIDRSGVTAEAAVSSGNVTILTVNEGEQEVIATSDRSINNRTYIEAQYSEGGETYTTRYNVTVANETVNNLGILPPVERFSASITDTNMQVIIIAAATGAAASIIATAFAGVAAMTMVMMMGWIAGYVGNGMAMVTVFIALFVGLNLAAQVDYTVRR